MGDYITLLRCVVFLLSLLISLGATSVDSLSPYQGKALLGFELEIGQQLLSNIVPQFDLDHLEKTVRDLDRRVLEKQTLQNYILKDYLTYPGALESLPAELRDELTNGLSLSSGLVEKPENVKPSQIIQLKIEKGSTGIVTPDGRAPGLSVPQKEFQNLPAQEINAVQFHAPESGVIRSRAADWQILNDRWNALPWNKKFETIQFKNLSPKKLAEIISRLPIRSGEREEMGHFLKLKPTAPESFSKIEFSLDAGTERTGKVFEANLKTPTQDPVEFLNTLEQFSKAAGANTQIELPTQVMRGNVAFHLHMTPLEPSANPAEFREIISLWNKRLLLRGLATGPEYSNLIDGASRSYNNMLTLHGGLINIRLDEHQGYHFETSLHLTSPKEEIREFFELFKQAPNEAKTKLTTDILSLIEGHPNLIEQMVKRNPEALLDFSEINPTFKQLAQDKIILNIETKRTSASNALESLFINDLSPDTLDVADQLILKFGNKMTGIELTSAINRRSFFKDPLPPKTTERLFRFLKEHPNQMSHQPVVFKELFNSKQWSELESDIAQYFFKNATPRGIENLLFIYKDKAPPREVLEILRSHLLSLSRDSYRTALALDFIHKYFPNEWYRVDPKPKGGSGVPVEHKYTYYPSLLDSFDREPREPEGRAAQFRKIFKGEAESDLWLRRVMSFVDFKEPRDLEAFAVLLNDPDIKSRMASAKAFAKYIQLRDSTVTQRLFDLVKTEEGRAAVLQAAKKQPLRDYLRNTRITGRYKTDCLRHYLLNHFI